MGDFPVFVSAAIFIGVILLLAVAGGLIFHRFVPHEDLVEHNEIAGFVFAVVGVVYAVLLAFLAIGVWEHFQSAEERTYEEASRLTVVYRKADLFPKAQSHALRTEIKRYIRLIVDREWREMRYGREDPEADVLSEHIAYQVRHLPVTTMAQQNVHAAMVQSMDEALVDRDSRTSLGAIGINGFIWFILWAGGAATIAFAYLFAYKTRWSLVAIVGTLAFMLGLVLYLIAGVDFPFQGAIHVGPEAFEAALHNIDRIGP
jgi:ABC-type multidrug transport system fused ATPase/permease subunit